jgi:alkylated DNA repair dioxygenase AlkB
VLPSCMTQEELPLVMTEREESSVPGFSLETYYISPAQEAELLASVNEGEWDTEWRRRVQRYGAGYGPGKDRAIVGPLPDWLLPLAERVSKDAAFGRFPENSVINEYEPGQGIAPHKDYSSFGPKVACVSLGSDVVLDFHSEDGTKKISVFVPARSLWVISGPARMDWLHGIAPRLFDTVRGVKRKRGRRISITFRTTANQS